jgi:hypothetical protein
VFRFNYTGLSYLVLPKLFSLSLSRAQEVPGFFVRFVFLASAAGGEEKVALDDDHDWGGKDIPDVFED